MDKSQIRSYIKEWVQMDDEIQKQKKKVKELTLAKKELSDKLLYYMKDQEIDQFDLNNGKLVRHVTKTKTSLSKRYLMDCLIKYYKDEEIAQKLSVFILDSREEKIKEHICKK
jgi:hypothetical protein